MRKEEKTERTRERILKAAMEEFGEKGYSGGTLNNICQGISKGLFYHNFASKDAVYLTCVKHCYERFTEYLDGEELGGDLQKYIDARLYFFRNHEQEARLFFETILQPVPHLQDQISEIRGVCDKLNQDLYRQLMSSVNLRPGVNADEARSYFDLMQTMFNGYFSSPAFRKMPFPDMVEAHETKLSKVLDFMLYGIAERGDEK